jgi:tetratricopeptide (TPR) repeat protein
LKELENLQETPEVLALKGALYWRLGKPEEARSASERALDGETEARAEALNTLGMLARSEGKFREALNFAQRAATLWSAMGRQARWADALNNIAVAKTLLGDPAEESFHEALEAAGGNLTLRARVLLNLGWVFEKQEKLDVAEATYIEAASLAEQANANDTATRCLNNLGAIYHRQGATREAKGAYERALKLARIAGERLMLGMIMANLAELTQDIEAWSEALRILEEAGHKEEADQYRTDLPLDHPFRQQEIQPNGN